MLEWARPESFQIEERHGPLLRRKTMVAKRTRSMYLEMLMPEMAPATKAMAKAARYSSGELFCPMGFLWMGWVGGKITRLVG